MRRLALLALALLATAASAQVPFSFEAVHSLDEMAADLRSRFPLGTQRDAVREVLVQQGGATARAKPGNPAIEKYVYDIDLCHYYVWRWNVSADYDDNGKLAQVWLNGDPLLAGGTPKRLVPTTAEPGKKASILRGVRPRPEAYKGETRLVYLLFDRDSDPATTDDQMLVGAGPSRPDPVDMGRMVSYINVDPWRSIFDADAADRIVPWQGDCAEADRVLQERKAAPPKP